MVLNYKNVFKKCKNFRHELYNFGVTVHILEPQVFKTCLAPPENLTSKMDSLWNGATDELRTEFGEKFHEKSIICFLINII